MAMLGPGYGWSSTGGRSVVPSRPDWPVRSEVHLNVSILKDIPKIRNELTMDAVRMHGLPAEGLRCAGIYANIFAADGFQHAQGIARCVFETCVTMDGRHAKKIESWTCRCK